MRLEIDLQTPTILHIVRATHDADPRCRSRSASASRAAKAERENNEARLSQTNYATLCTCNHTITRFSIQTAGLAFGGTGLCSYRVRGVGGSFAEHLTVESFIIGIPSPTHSFTLGLNPSFSANPPYRSLSFVSFKIHYMDFPYCLLLLLSISVFLLFSFSVFTHF